MTAASDNWYLAQIRPGEIKRARINLARQGFRSFMPVRDATARCRGRLRQVRRALFPGYLFVRIDPERQQWRKINSTFGVARLVALESGRPSRVPAGIMAELFERCDGESWRAGASGLRPGRQARLLQGPFTEMIATVESLPDNDRVFVLLDLMGRRTRVGVRRDDLETIGPEDG